MCQRNGRERTLESTSVQEEDIKVYQAGPQTQHPGLHSVPGIMQCPFLT